MKKTFVAFLAVATIAGSAVAVPAPAHAQRYLGAAIFGGLLGGAIVGSAIASRPAYGGPVYVEDGGPVPVCRVVRERFWDGYDYRYRRVQYCN
jgi:hypothetical protein